MEPTVNVSSPDTNTSLGYGSCTPFIYIASCPTEQQDVYIRYAQVWAGIDIFSFLLVIGVLIHRWIVVKERFNTLRLILIKTLLGTVCCLTNEMIRATGFASQWNVPTMLMSFTFAMGYSIQMNAYATIAITWKSLLDKRLMTQVSIFGSPVLYFGILIPHAICSIVCSILMGISRNVYIIAFRFMFASWALVAAFVFYMCVRYGYSGYKRLQLLNDPGTLVQQIIAYAIVGACFGLGTVALTIEAIFLDPIDASVPLSIFFRTMYGIFIFALQAGFSTFCFLGAIGSPFSTRTRASRVTTGRSRNLSSKLASQNNPKDDVVSDREP